MVRILILLLGTLSQRRIARREAAWPGAAQRYGDGWSVHPHAAMYAGTAPAARPDSPGQPGDLGWPTAPETFGPAEPPASGGGPRPRDRRGGRGRIPRWAKWSAVLVVAGLIFRRAVASVAVMALSATLHFFGLNVHLPHIRFAWPWQTISAGTTTNTQLGPWVLQKIEGISRPALGTENFNFVFTHKVSKNIGPWPCWYSSTFYAVGHASATVNLNPGPSWWTPSAGHYRLQVLRLPQQGRPGQVSIVMVLPQPQLPQNVHEVTIDNTLSKPLVTQHSWTYPGLGCGALIRPQFAESVVYAQAQSEAFYRVNHVSAVTRPLVSAAETEAAQIVRNNFIQPTVNAFGYTLESFSLHWAAAP